MSETIIRQGFRYRLRPSGQQAALLRRFAGCRRFVWNKALAEQEARKARAEPYAGYVEMAKWLTGWRRGDEFGFLREAPVHGLQNALKDLDAAFQRFFRKEGGYPKLKRKGEREGFRETDVDCFKIDESNARIKLPKLGWIRYRRSREIEGAAKSVSVSLDALGWHASIQAERTIEAIPQATSIGAGDRGVKSFLALADGSLVEPLNAHKKALKRLRRYQRSCSRKERAQKKALGLQGPIPKGTRLPVSNRLKRERDRLARYWAKIGRMRKDWLHKLSSDLSDRHAAFVLEDLRIKNMSASAKGDIESPGKNVKAKAGLNRSILDQGWGEFERQLQYKLAWKGGELLLVDPRNTSRKCSSCGFVDGRNRKGERFRCLACGHEEHADIQAAKNILAAGRAVLAGRYPGYAGVEDRALKSPPAKRQPALEADHAIQA